MSSGLPDFPQTIPPDTLLGRTGINAGPVQALPFSTLASIFPPPPAPPAGGAVYKNIVTDFAAVGDGVTDNTNAFGNFAGYALALQVPNPTPIVLTIPPGVYLINHADGGGFFQGIPNITILGYGATITNKFGADFPALTAGIRGAYSWRIQSTKVGDNSFTILLANNAMAFAGGNLQSTNVQNYTPSTGAAFVQSINSYTTGKFYFEATITAVVTGAGTRNIGVGFSNGYGPVNTASSSIVGTRSFMAFDDGTISQQFVGSGDSNQVGGLGASFANGNVIGCAIDITNQLGWFRINNGNWNGSSSANPVTGVGGLALSGFNPAGFSGWQLTPAFVCTYISANPGSVTHNFGGSGYAFTRPSGFADWSGTLNPNYPVNIQAGDWVAVASADAQDANSSPPNWQFVEYHQVATVNASTGVCTIQRPFMRYAHSATLADNSINRNQFSDHGGPASVFLFSPTANVPNPNNAPGNTITGGGAGAGVNGPNRIQPWNQTVNVFGMTLPGLGNMAQNFHFVDCTFTGVAAPTLCQRAVFDRCSFNGGTEIDKIVTQVEFINCDWGSVMNMLTSSVELATFDNCSFSNHVNTSAKQCIYRNCVIDTMDVGASYSQNQTLQVENCIIGQFGNLANPQLQLSDATFANGIFTINLDTIPTNTMANYWRFAIPGLTAFISSGGANRGSPFTITDANNILKGGILTATIAGGAAYTNGTYNYVPLTGGLGAQALANIVVSGGAVTSVTLINEGVHYSVSDVLTTAAANIGGTGAGFTYTVNTVSANDIVQIFTTLAALPTYSGTSSDSVSLLQAPSVAFNGTIGNGQAIALSQAQDGLPAFSYMFMEISGNQWAGANTGSSIIPQVRSLGYAVKLRVNVRKPYTGASGTLVLNLFNQFQRVVLTQSGSTWTAVNYNPQFDLKVAGERIITANRVSGLQPNDTERISGTLVPFGQMWFEDDAFQPFLSASIAADTVDKWPVVDIEIVTDQSIGTVSSVGTIDYLQEPGWHVVATTYTAQIGEKIAANTTGGAFTLTLPPSPAIGDFVKAYDAGNTFTANNLTIARNGNNINSAAANFTASTSGQVLELVFINATIGWRVFT